MASQMTLTKSFRLTQTFLQYSHLSENMVTIPMCIRSNTDLLSSRLRQVHNWPGVRRDFRKFSHSSFQCRNPTESILSKNDFRQCCFGVWDRLHGDRLNGSKHFSTVDTVVDQVTLPSQRLWVPIENCCRKFSTSALVANKFGVGVLDREKPATSHTDAGKNWALRLANENGYLSWCRNTYLTTVVALALIEEGKTAFAEQAAEGALVVAALNMTWGTYQYISNIIQLRRQTGMSIVGVAFHASLAILHLLLWFMVCATFMGYAEDPDGTAVEGEA